MIASIVLSIYLAIGLSLGWFAFRLIYKRIDVCEQNPESSEHQEMDGMILACQNMAQRIGEKAMVRVMYILFALAGLPVLLWAVCCHDEKESD